MSADRVFSDPGTFTALLSQFCQRMKPEEFNKILAEALFKSLQRVAPDPNETQRDDDRESDSNDDEDQNECIEESKEYRNFVSMCNQRFSARHLLLPGTDILRQKVR